MKKILSSFVLSAIIAPFTGGFGLAFGILAVIAMITPSIPGVAMIAIVDGQALLTKKVVAVYKENISVPGFLRSFFPSVESLTEKISIAVNRGTDKVAVDVKRYSDGNRNKFSFSTEKMFKPPFYHEYLTASDHELYNTVIGMLGSTNGQVFFSQMTKELAEQMFELQKKMERAMELQCSEVFTTGIVQLAAGTNIDFKRKAASLLAYSAVRDFAIGTVNPHTVLEQGAVFLKTIGRANGGVYNCIMGSEVYSAMIQNTIFKSDNDLVSMSLDAIREPQREASGGVLHGSISAGSFTVRIWTYPETFTDSSGTLQNYIHPKDAIMIPENPNFLTAYAAVPQLISDNGTIPQTGRYLIQDFVDQKKASHEMHIKSAGVAVPVGVDQIWTARILN